MIYIDLPADLTLEDDGAATSPGWPMPSPLTPSPGVQC
jgi:hypothetical protein